MAASSVIPRSGVFCHSEERSDEESGLSPGRGTRSLASLGMTRRRRARDGGVFCHSEERRLLSFRGAERRGIWTLYGKRDQIYRCARDERTAEGSGWRRLLSFRGAASSVIPRSGATRNLVSLPEEGPDPSLRSG